MGKVLKFPRHPSPKQKTEGKAIGKRQAAVRKAKKESQ